MLNFLSKQVLKKRYREFSQSQQDLLWTQEKALEAFKANFPINIKAKNYREFIKNTPAQEYNDIKTIKDLINRPKDYGVHYFALTSGTTGPSKIFPYTKSVGKIMKRAQITAASLFHHKTQQNPVTMKSIILGGSCDVELPIQNIKCGTTSGYLSQFTPKILQKKRFPKTNTQNINDFEAKVEAILNECGHENINGITTLPSYFEFMMQTILKLRNVKDISEIWPQLQYFVYSGSSVMPYKERINELMGKEIDTFGIYISTESPMGVEAHMFQTGLPGYLLNAEDVIYGFAYDDGTIATIDELKEGDNVRILISMPNGLHNYIIGDRVLITSTKPYFTLEPIGREGAILDTFGEKVLERDLQVALKNVSKKLGISPDHFFVYPELNEQKKKYYQWVLVQNSDHCEKSFNQAIDESLMEISTEYRDIRKEMNVLSHPKSQVISNELTNKIFKERSHKCQLKFKTIFPSRTELNKYLNIK